MQEPLEKRMKIIIFACAQPDSQTQHVIANLTCPKRININDRTKITTMRNFLLLLFLLSCLGNIKASEVDNPKANPKAVVTRGNARFTVLTPEMIRIQYSKKALFEDRATFGVVNRNLPVPKFKTTEENGWLEIKTSALTLRYKVGDEIDAAQRNSKSLNITLTMNGKQVLWYPGKDNALNLKGTTRTLDGQMGDNKRKELEDGVVSRAGWAVIDESPLTKRGDGSTTFAFDKKAGGIDWWAEPVDKEAVDWYFMGYGHEYRKAVSDYAKIGGHMNMPPLYTLGYWYSKYQKYTQQEFMDIVNEIKSHDIPLDVMIFDMDWHDRDWTGWTWDKTVIPEPEKLIKFMHDNKLRVALNLHPADGVDNDEEFFSDMTRDLGLPASTKNIPWNLEDSTFYKVMFKDILRKREAQGVDFWWLDWQQHLLSKNVKGLGETFWHNHVFYNDMRVNRPDRRPVIFHRWGGLGSHRYPLGFSGDSFTTFGTLAFQPCFTATASNVCFGYWGHDLGGHQQFLGNDPELYLRWIQYGVFSPLFRTHATSSPDIERRIWKYSNFTQLRDAVNLRYRLMPYIYNAAREAYDTGIAICRPLYYYWPERNEAYDNEGEYMFGSNMLVAPVTKRSGKDKLVESSGWLPEGLWFDVCKNRMVEGNTTITQTYTLDDTPRFVKAGSIIPCYPHITNLKSCPEKLILEVYPGGNGSINYYEDNGDDNGYQRNEYATTLIAHKNTVKGSSLTIHPRKGSYKNMPTKRSYEVVFKTTERPDAVKLNGKAMDSNAWRWDDKTGDMTVLIADASFNKTYKIEF